MILTVKTPAIMTTKQELAELGFTLDGPRTHEDVFSFDSHTLTINDSYIGVITEFDTKGNFTKQFFDLNDRTLEGRSLTSTDIKILKEIL